MGMELQFSWLAKGRNPWVPVLSLLTLAVGAACLKAQEWELRAGCSQNGDQFGKLRQSLPLSKAGKEN